jgi:hypothetical protein
MGELHVLARMPASDVSRQNLSRRVSYADRQVRRITLFPTMRPMNLDDPVGRLRDSVARSQAARLLHRSVQSLANSLG